MGFVTGGTRCRVSTYPITAWTDLATPAPIRPATNAHAICEESTHFDVFHHPTGFDLPDLGEQLVQLLVGHRLRQIVDYEVRHARVLRLHFDDR